MKNERISIKNKTFELNESNDIYMTLNFPILSNDVNYNNLQFTDDFINGIVENKEKYIGIPLVVNREKLESAEYDKLGHELKNGQLLTDQVGSHVDFWTEEIDGALCLMSSIRVMKRFPNVCNAIIELYDNGDLESSCEVLVSEYLEITEDKVRKVHYNGGKNVYIGSAIVSEPAETRSRATLLVAEAYKKDIEEKEGNCLLKNFNKGNNISYHGSLEINALKLEDVSNQIYNKLNPIDAKTGDRKYNFWIRDIFVEYTIVEDWDNYKELYKIPYSIVNDEVILAEKTQWQKGYLGFVPEGLNIDQLQLEMVELNTEITKLKEEVHSHMNNEELQAELSTKEVEIAEFITKVDDLEKKVKELSETIVSQESTKKELEEKVTELNTAIEELSKYKEQVETAEKEAKVKEINEKYSKLLPEEVLNAETTQSLINELNVAELNELVVNEVAKQKNEIEVNQKGDSDVLISSKQPENLLPSDIVSKYDLSI